MVLVFLREGGLILGLMRSSFLVVSELVFS
jgi:hypothetical protein